MKPTTGAKAQLGRGSSRLLDDTDRDFIIRPRDGGYWQPMIAVERWKLWSAIKRRGCFTTKYRSQERHGTVVQAKSECKGLKRRGKKIIEGCSFHLPTFFSNFN